MVVEKPHFHTRDPNSRFRVNAQAATTTTRILAHYMVHCTWDIYYSMSALCLWRIRFPLGELCVRGGMYMPLLKLNNGGEYMNTSPLPRSL